MCFFDFFCFLWVFDILYEQVLLKGGNQGKTLGLLHPCSMYQLSRNLDPRQFDEPNTNSPLGQPRMCFRVNPQNSKVPVSYTHLTLPTTVFV